MQMMSCSVGLGTQKLLDVKFFIMLTDKTGSQAARSVLSHLTYAVRLCITNFQRIINLQSFPVLNTVELPKVEIITLVRHTELVF